MNGRLQEYACLWEFVNSEFIWELKFSDLYHGFVSSAVWLGVYISIGVYSF